jgi:TRAP-type C4-dicarboxylate transport system substrate-binding protein
VIEEFAGRIEQGSGGEVRIKPVWRAAGPNERAWDQRVAKKVVTGELDMGLIPARAWDSEGVTSLRALQAPFLIRDDVLLDEVATGPLAEKMLAGLEDVGVVGLALLPDELRHPVGFGRPLLSLDDFRGARIRAPLSEVTFDLLRALGAEPVDLAPGEFERARAAGTLRGMESGLARVGTFPAEGAVFTGNIVLSAKASTLVASEDAFEALPDDRRDALREAARETLGHVLGTRPYDDELASERCAGQTRVVLATLPQVAELKEAARPVFAELERDPQTRSLIAQIEAMKQEIPAADGAPACDPPDHSIAEPGDPGVLNGVWRSERPTYEEGIEAGLSESTAAQEMGAQTIRMRNGRYEWDWRPRTGDGYCVGRYEVGGNRVTFKDALPCEGVWGARFRLQGDEVRWSAVRSHTGIAEDQLLNELLHIAPWKRIG